MAKFKLMLTNEAITHISNALLRAEEDGCEDPTVFIEGVIAQNGKVTIESKYIIGTCIQQYTANIE